MKRKLYTLLLLTFGLLAVQAEAQHKIDLVKGANAIVKLEETVFTVNSAGSGTTRIKTIITILNESGKEHARLQVAHDRLNKVDYIKGTSYDLAGKKIKSLKSSEIKDVSAGAGDNEILDTRVKYADMAHTVYPYTVEYEYQTTSSNMMFYPVWVPLASSKLSVEKATFQVLMPKGMKLRYRETNLQEKVKQSATATHDVYSWEVQNLTPLDTEPYGPFMAEVIPMVRTAPADFEVEGYRGSMESWQKYGHFINQLNAGRDVLPEATKQKLQALTADTKDPLAKIDKVYNYLQSNTRYVSIQLGLGGWQPLEAGFVASKGYGDCKALTNYTQAMLKEVGVPSFQALIRGGENEPAIMTDFPSSQFNHVVLCVPLQQDTLWLECTSQNESAGFSGSFTGSRKALLITPEGGKLVNTPSYTAADNTEHRTVKVKLDENGNGTANVISRYTGEEHETYRDLIHHYAAEEQRKWLYSNIKVPAFEVKKFAFDLKKGRQPEVTEKLELSLRQCATLSGKRMFLTPNLMNKWTTVPNTVEKRKWEVVRNSAYTNVDTVVYEMPVGYTLEFKPNDTEYKTAFGTYKATTKVDGQQVTYIRSLQMNKGRFSPDTYAKMIEFMNNMLKADAQQVVFVKNIP
ncbi:DUF3857 domain-containing protein [Pontibacter ruber]|uniref:DUF3857 domain-containing protein n=1 Tax=Pontibacter ruber TaxID=1343895 RepID=A0ABW5D2M0_9BACT|nr:DUF3857 and transglutaminase domain-containing protein [Pontibacter ruber]